MYNYLQFSIAIHSIKNKKDKIFIQSLMLSFFIVALYILSVLSRYSCSSPLCMNNVLSFSKCLKVQVVWKVDEAIY